MDEHAAIDDPTIGPVGGSQAVGVLEWAVTAGERLEPREHARAIVGMKQRGKEVRIADPPLYRVAEHPRDLRIRVDVGRRRIGAVDVQAGGQLLDEHAVAVLGAARPPMLPAQQRGEDRDGRHDQEEQERVSHVLNPPEEPGRKERGGESADAADRRGDEHGRDVREPELVEAVVSEERRNYRRRCRYGDAGERNDAERPPAGHVRPDAGPTIRSIGRVFRKLRYPLDIPAPFVVRPGRSPRTTGIPTRGNVSAETANAADRGVAIGDAGARR